MPTWICSFFLLGCLAFFCSCNIVIQFEGLIFGVNLVCVGALYDWEYLGGALFPFCPVRQPDYFCLTHTNDCNSPPHTLTLIHFTFLLLQVFTCTQSHWTNEHCESCVKSGLLCNKGFFTTELQYLYHQDYLHIFSIWHFHCSNSRFDHHWFSSLCWSM